MSLHCPGCGSTNVVDDDLYCQTQRVCADCGSLVSEGTLAPEPVGGSDVNYSRTTAVSKKPCANLIRGLERVKEISQILRVYREIGELASMYFKQAYEHKSFINVTLQRKEVLSGCCVLVSCKQHRWPVTMGTISCLLNVDPIVVGEVYQEMIKVLNIQAPTFNIIDVLESHCQEYKISSCDVPEELAEDSRQLNKRAAALLELAADSWIMTGRRPVPIMMAVIYLAWQSLKPSACRLKMSPAKFCALAKVQMSKPAVKRITEMKEVLCKLGKEIPWLGQDVTPENVVRSVGEILQHRYSLLRRAMRSHEAALEENCLTPDDNSLTAGTASAKDSERTDQREGTSVNQNCSRVTEEELTGDGERQSDARDQKLEPNWGKRVLFAPPCVVNAKRRRVSEPTAEVNGDEEISDSEIDSYLRTPKEVSEFVKKQKMLSMSSAEKQQ